MIFGNNKNKKKKVSRLAAFGMGMMLMTGGIPVYGADTASAAAPHTERAGVAQIAEENESGGVAWFADGEEPAGAVHKGNAENTENKENSENKSDTQNTEDNKGDTENTEINKGNTENTGNNKDNTENTENKGSTENKNKEISTDTKKGSRTTNGKDNAGNTDQQKKQKEESKTSASKIVTMRVKVRTKKVSERKVKISWSKVKGSTYYQVQQLKKGKWKNLKKLKKTSFQMKLKTLKKVKLRVRSYKGDKSLCAKSDATVIRMPGAVSGFTSKLKGAASARLSWKKAKAANDYRIYFKDSKGKYVLLTELKKNKKTIKLSGKGNYRLKLVPLYKKENVEIAGKAVYCSFSNGQIVSLSHQKYSYSEMVKDLFQLRNRYGENLRIYSLGTTSGGRTIYDAVLGNPSASRKLLVVAAIHAREYVTTAICMKQLEYYLDNYYSTVDGKKLSSVFDRCCVHYVMMANPDGVTISQNGKSRWKANGRGVDLNQNFPYLYEKKGKKSDGTSTGSEAGSERETKIIMNLSKNLKNSGNLSVLNYHAMGNIVFGGYSGKSSYLKTRINKMYAIARNTTGYADASGYGGTGAGNYREYLMFGLGIPSITIEVGNTPCPLPASSYNDIFARNYLVVLREAAL